MAYWTSTGNSYIRVKLLWLGRDSEKHFFEIDNNGHKDQANFVEWYLTKIELDSYEYQEKKRDLFKLYMQDNEEKYCISLSFTRTSRSILNSILWVAKKEKEISKKVRLFLFISEKNGKFYKNAGVSYGGDRTERLFSIDEQKKLMREVKDPDTWEILKIDYSKLDKKMMDEIETINKKIKQPQEEHKLQEEYKPQEDNEDLPF